MKRFLYASGAIALSVNIAAASETRTYNFLQLPYLDAYITDYSCDSSTVKLDIYSRSEYIFTNEVAATEINKFTNNYFYSLLREDRYNDNDCIEKSVIKRYYINDNKVYESPPVPYSELKNNNYSTERTPLDKTTLDGCFYTYFSNKDNSDPCNDTNLLITDLSNKDHLLTKYFLDMSNQTEFFSVGELKYAFIGKQNIPNGYRDLIDNLDNRQLELCEAGLSIYCLADKYNTVDFFYDISEAKKYGTALHNFTIKQINKFQRAADRGHFFASKVIDDLKLMYPDVYLSLSDTSANVSMSQINNDTVEVSINRWMSNKCVDKNAVMRVAKSLSDNNTVSQYMPLFLDSHNGCLATFNKSTAVGVGVKEIRNLSCSPSTMEFAKCSFVTVIGANFRTGDGAADRLFSSMWNRHVRTSAEFANVPGYGWMVLGLQTH